MEHLKTSEVARRIDQRQICEELISLAIPEADIFVRTHDPLAARFMQVNWCVFKRVAPIDHSGVVMGMGDGNGGETAQRFHALDGRVVKKTDAVPENISFRRLN